MSPAREKWTRIETAVKVEAPRKTYRFASLFVSPGGLFVPTDEKLDPHIQLSVSFAIEQQAVMAHVELRKILVIGEAAASGIDYAGAGWQMRLIRMEGDGSQILAEHIKKMVMQTGGPR